MIDIKKLQFSTEDMDDIKNFIMINHGMEIDDKEPLLIFGTVTKFVFDKFTEDFNENLNGFTYKLNELKNELLQQVEEKVQKTNTEIDNSLKEFKENISNQYDEKSRVVLKSINDKLLSDTKKNDEIVKKYSSLKDKNFYIYTFLATILIFQTFIIYLLV